MLATDPESQQDAERRLPGESAIPAPGCALSPAAVAHVHRLRVALISYGRRGGPGDMETAFAAARGLVAASGAPAGDRPDLETLRRLASAVPEFDAFLSAAADEADRLVRTAAESLWTQLGLHSGAPRWNAAERETARMLFACACAPGHQDNPARLRSGLRTVGSGRFAARLSAELAAREEPWMHALGERYRSVRHRCAPRTTWRSRGLSELVRGDERARVAVTTRLERWLAGGGAAASLGAELEAALVHARTPPRFA